MGIYRLAATALVAVMMVSISTETADAGGFLKRLRAKRAAKCCSACTVPQSASTCCQDDPLKCFKCQLSPGQSEPVCCARLQYELACCRRSYSGSTLSACQRYAHTRYLVCTLNVGDRYHRYYRSCPCYCNGDPGQACESYPACTSSECYMNRGNWCLICETCSSSACDDCPQECIDLGCPHCVEN